MTSIIPAIDLINGKCVRLTLGDYNQEKVYDEDPLKVAIGYEKVGAKRLHIVDLDAAKDSSKNNKLVIHEIIKNTNLEIQIGGGLKETYQVKELLDWGAAKVIVGSKAQKDKEGSINWLETFGPDKIIIGADVRNEKIAINGWMDTSTESIFDFITFYTNHGANQFLCTDISKDGLLQGPSLDLYRTLMDCFTDVDIIASGGVSSEEDIKDLRDLGIKSIIVGKAIYEEKVDIEQLIGKY